MEIKRLSQVSLKAILAGIFVKFLSNFILNFSVVLFVGIAHVAFWGAGAEPIPTSIMHVMTFFSSFVACIFAGSVAFKKSKESPFLNILILGVACSVWNMQPLLSGLPTVSGTPLWYGYAETAMIIPALLIGGWLALLFPTLGKHSLPPLFYRIAFLLLLNAICIIRGYNFRNLFTNFVDFYSSSPHPSSSFIPAILFWIFPFLFFWFKGFKGVRFRKTVLLLALLISEWPLLLIISFFVFFDYKDPFLYNFVAHLSGVVK